MLDAIFCTKGEYREIVLSIFQRMGESLAYLYLTVSYLLVLSNGNEPELACWRVITPSEIPAAVQYGNAVPPQSTRLYNIFGFMNVAQRPGSSSLENLETSAELGGCRDGRRAVLLPSLVPRACLTFRARSCSSCPSSATEWRRRSSPAS